MKRDRRALVFLIFAAVCALLVPIAEPGHRWVAEVTGLTYVVLAAASALDAWSRSRS
ncbi:MAG: hypothetical protein QOJ00_1917 [Actinomycetota bacterium]